MGHQPCSCAREDSGRASGRNPLRLSDVPHGFVQMAFSPLTMGPWCFQRTCAVLVGGSLSQSKSPMAGTLSDKWRVVTEERCRLLLSPFGKEDGPLWEHYEMIFSPSTLSWISEIGYGLNYAFLKNVFSLLSNILKWTLIIVTKLYVSALSSAQEGHRWNVAGPKRRVMEKSTTCVCYLNVMVGKWISQLPGTRSYRISLAAIRGKRLL